MVEELQWCLKLQICDNGWLLSAYSHSVLPMKSLCRCIEKKLVRMKFLKMASIDSEVHQSGN